MTAHRLADLWPQPEPTPPLPARNHRCRIVVSGQRCEQPGIYIIRIEDCPHEWCAGGLWCRGHPACVEHAAMTRAGKYETSDDSHWKRHKEPVEVGHIANGAWTW